MAVNIEPTKAYDAYQEWVVKSISETDQKQFSLGQFFFGVSSGTIGTLIALYRLTDTQLAILDWIALAITTTSMLVALNMVLPKEIIVNHNSDLQRMHTALVRKNTRIIYGWVMVWSAGLAIAAFGLFS